MRKSLVAAAVLVGSAGTAWADNYTLDPDHTYPHFSVSHLGFSTMIGRFEKTTGKMSLDTAKKTGSVEVTIDVNSLSTAHAKRDQHLKSPDFFNAAEFPTMTFKSTKVNFNGDKVASVDGNLTIMKTTKPVTLTITNSNCGVHPMNKKTVCGFDATGKIKRSEFGMNYGTPAIGDDVTLMLEVEGIKE